MAELTSYPVRGLEETFYEDVEERGKESNRINYDEELWIDTLQHTDLIVSLDSLHKYSFQVLMFATLYLFLAYKFQGLEILTKSSRACDKEVLCSMENDTATSKEV
ncbi:hypothetical protein G6F57_010687 [Rhizopus arrhizus]|uniref:Uncharacterized protein n=1 Tax=Rhizopus oryzae TaxID=64495 RepID=A0A9P7BNJ8_RHIOR|nr:hypothetical protein G6F23_006951 [Rhizopus arrhizus]KAG1412021.1 hypothetical protein G6F58_008246 [Rhizopus delemar]KAG0757251.1 hypothetical protein G6F24_010608 [Rhizopus arrhizus]KAG0783322.1 hypothetical protein G6F21_010604 [Rhizopus arrhizus]KAG0794457.1 hypothetical protein G6F22_005350 [Rhizopus arrhizus]